MKKAFALIASFAFYAGTANGAPPIPTPQEYVAAGKKFEALKTEANKHNTMPRIADKNVADTLRVLSDERVLTSNKFTVQDVGTLLDICGKTNEINMSYALFDLQKEVDPKDEAAAITGKVKTVMKKNIMTFQDEIFQLQPFLVKCFATGLPLMSEFMETLPAEKLTDARRKGAVQVRNGTLSMYYGALTGISDERIKQSNRLKMLDALSETAPVYAISLPAERRKQLHDAVSTALQSAGPAFRSQLEKIQKAMEEAGCSALCKL